MVEEYFDRKAQRDISFNQADDVARSFNTTLPPNGLRVFKWCLRETVRSRERGVFPNLTFLCIVGMLTANTQDNRRAYYS